VGDTTFEVLVVNAASLYQVNVPTEQVPVRVLEEPEQMEDGLAVNPVGATGMAITATVTTLEATLQLEVPIFPLSATKIR
jgi:hypothetical protein